MATDNFQAHDYYLMDELLSDEHKLLVEQQKPSHITVYRGQLISKD